MTATPREQRPRSARPARAAGAADDNGAGMRHWRAAGDVVWASAYDIVATDDGPQCLPPVGESKYCAAPAEGPDLLTVAQVMARLQIGRHNVYELIRSRRLQSVLIGRCRRIPVTALHDFLNSLTDSA